MIEPLTVTADEAAELLGLSPTTIEKLIREGDLPVVRFGRRRMIPRRAIDAVLEAALQGFDPSSLAVAVRSGGVGPTVPATSERSTAAEGDEVLRVVAGPDGTLRLAR